MVVKERGNAGLDTSTHESLLVVSQPIETIKRRQARKIAFEEEIARGMGKISDDTLNERAFHVNHKCSPTWKNGRTIGSNQMSTMNLG